MLMSRRVWLACDFSVERILLSSKVPLCNTVMAQVLPLIRSILPKTQSGVGLSIFNPSSGFGYWTVHAWESLISVHGLETKKTYSTDFRPYPANHK